VGGTAFAAAAALKPSLLGALPVVAAIGRWRWAGAAVAGTAALAALSAVVSGPGLLREYQAEVLPRALLYGEGGTEEMLLPASRFPSDGGGDAVVVDGRAYHASLWELPLSASVPRLLAPRSPSRPAALAPYAITALALAWAARRRGARRDDAPAGARETLLAGAAVVACVVTSPTGWVMGLVWALPLASPVARLRASGRVPPGAALGLAAAWLACALPPLVEGWGALAGAALVIAVAALAVRLPAEAAP
jgi:hypothetical protein